MIVPAYRAHLRLLAILAALAVGGCATQQTAPAGSKAVSKPCPTSMPDKPAFPADRLAGDADIWTIVTTLWADRKTRQAYELALEIRLKGCVEPDAP